VAGSGSTLDASLLREQTAGVWKPNHRQDAREAVASPLAEAGRRVKRYISQHPLFGSWNGEGLLPVFMREKEDPSRYLACLHIRGKFPKKPFSTEGTGYSPGCNLYYLTLASVKPRLRGLFDRSRQRSGVRMLFE